MSDSPNAEHARGALSAEWLVARIVVVGGIVVAVAAIVWFGLLQPAMLRRETLARIQLHQTETVRAVTQLCKTGLSAAQSFGIVPPYGQLYGHNIYRTNVQGRYVCVASTHATRYLVAVDLFCRNVKDRRCVSLYSVTQANGAVLYQRRS
ncbi:MAG TPA: hypothetical protein VII49_09760 [Rhizomicrobium sp.]